MLRLRVKTPRGDHVLEVDATSTLGDLRQRVQTLTSIEAICQQLLFTHPMKEIISSSSTRLSEVPLRSGDSVMVRVTDPVMDRLHASTPAPSAPSAAPSPTELKGATPNTIISTNTTSNTDNASAAGSVINASDSKEKEATAEQKLLISSAASMVPRQRIIDHDNSCLFNALGYALEGRNRHASENLRTVVAGVIASAPDHYTEGYLGKAPDAYIEWIMDSEKWGGAIEMAILSDYYEAEIAAVDIETNNVYIYGQDKGFTKRAYLLYNGIHYDTLVCNPIIDGKDEKLDMTIFAPSDNDIKERFVALAAELKKNKKYTNVQKFSLRCADCNTPFVGAVEATEHAKKTRHVNFTEYK